jgi:copper(I)-binding protein
MRLTRPFAVLCLLGIANAPISVGAHGLEVTSGWTTPEGAGANSEIYLTIENDAFHPVYMLGASSPVADRVELHRMTGEAMAPVKQIEIPLDDRLDMQRSGYHFMLIGLKRPLRAGETVPLTLRLGDGEVQKTRFTVTIEGGDPTGDVKRRH